MTFKSNKIKNLGGVLNNSSAFGVHTPPPR